jgi:hypothetical protein
MCRVAFAILVACVSVCWGTPDAEAEGSEEMTWRRLLTELFALADGVIVGWQRIR